MYPPHRTSSVSPCVESIRLSLTILHLLLSTPTPSPNSQVCILCALFSITHPASFYCPQSNLLEWNLANTYPHIVSNIASYIYHHGDTRIPIGGLYIELTSLSFLSVDSCHSSADSALSGHTPLCILVARGRCCRQERCLCLQTLLTY